MAFCPVIQSIDFSTTLQINDPFYPLSNWNEISGTAVSPTQIAPSGFPVLFGHNDGPESTKTFAAWDSGTGKRLKTINLDTNDPNIPLRHEDWEDMTIGKCGPDTEESCLYIADTGDNKAQGSGYKTQRSIRRPYTIYKIREPILSNVFDNTALDVENHVSILQFNYSHVTSPTPYANSEAIFLDHTGWGDDNEVGDLYLVTKWNVERSKLLNRIFKIPASAWPEGFGKVATYSPFTVGEYSDTGNTAGSFYNFTWTGADMSLDGTKIALTWVNETHIFPRCPGESVASAVARRGLRSCTNYENPKGAANPGNQFESVSFSPDGKRMFNLAESLDPPKIVHVDLEDSATSRNQPWQCPDYVAPTRRPTVPPTDKPTPRPTPEPTGEPTILPSIQPSVVASLHPTAIPSVPPSEMESGVPSPDPSMATSQPTDQPTAEALELDVDEYSLDDDEFIQNSNSYGGQGNLRIPAELVEVSGARGPELFLLVLLLVLSMARQ